MHPLRRGGPAADPAGGRRAGAGRHRAARRRPPSCRGCGPCSRWSSRSRCRSRSTTPTTTSTGSRASTPRRAPARAGRWPAGSSPGRDEARDRRGARRRGRRRAWRWLAGRAGSCCWSACSRSSPRSATAAGPKPYASAGLGEVIRVRVLRAGRHRRVRLRPGRRLTLLAVLASVPMGRSPPRCWWSTTCATSRPTRRRQAHPGGPARGGPHPPAVRRARRGVAYLAGAAGRWSPAGVARCCRCSRSPLAWPGVELVRTPARARADPALGHTAQAQLLFAVLLTVGSRASPVAGGSAAGTSRAA
jgi:hypothetical protein